MDVKHAIANTVEAATLSLLRISKRDQTTRNNQVYVINYNDNKIRCGVFNGSTASIAADSGDTLNIRMSTNPSQQIRMLNKVFILPGGQAVTATELATYPFKVSGPALEEQITQGITGN